MVVISWVGTECGDIGCYTLGNAIPLDMVDTCLCMGAGLGIAQGIGHMEPDTACFAFVGDSTFFASAVTGVINAVYNQANMTLIILDNSTTAMTGHQPHPGTGQTMMGEIVQKINIESVLRGIGLTVVETVNPLDYQASLECVKQTADEPGVKAIIFKSPCIALTRPSGSMTVDSRKCTGCRKCIRELGCPALILSEGRVCIDSSLCTGCSLCAQICPAGAICSPKGCTPCPACAVCSPKGRTPDPAGEADASGNNSSCPADDACHLADQGGVHNE